MTDTHFSDNDPYNYCGDASEPMEGSVRNVMLSLLATNPEISVIAPGVIRPALMGKSSVQIRITVAVPHGWKVIAKSAGTQQELFIATSLARKKLAAAIKKAVTNSSVERRRGITTD
jgi:hypothetical protein